MWNMLNFSDQLSMTMNLISKFHDFMLIYLTLILILILSLLSFSSSNLSLNLFFNDLNTLEVLWTIFPLLVIISIMFPSLKILYSNESLMISYYQLTLKIMGNQWFWSFSLNSNIESMFFLKNKNSNNLFLDSFISKEKNFLKFNSLQMMNVSNKIIIPYMTPIRVLISSSDVIHSWSIPSLGVKMDAVPGRINQLEIFLKSMGVFFGQCTEICGMNHSIMPFMIFCLPLKDSILINELLKLTN